MGRLWPIRPPLSDEAKTAALDATREAVLPTRLSAATLRATVGVRGSDALTVQAALPNVAAATVNYNDAAAPPLRVFGLGSSVGLGPNGTADPVNAVSARLFAGLSPILNPLGNLDLTLTNGSAGGSIAAEWPDHYVTTVATAGGPPILVCLVAGMNDGMPAQYHGGQTYPFFADRVRALITRAQTDGADVVLCTTPHPHSTRTPWDYGGPVAYPDGQRIPAGNVVQVRNADGAQVTASYRHLRINEALRLIAADTGTLLLDAEHYWLRAVAVHGEDALFDAGQYNHPNLAGFEQSFYPAIADLTAALTAPTVRGGVVGGQRNPLPLSRTGGSRDALPSGGTLTVALLPETAGRLTIFGTSGGGWHSVWSGSFVTTDNRAAVGPDGSAFTAPGQLIEAVTGSDADTTVAIRVVNTGSGSVVSWAADYFTAY